MKKEEQDEWTCTGTNSLTDEEFTFLEEKLNRHSWGTLFGIPIVLNHYVPQGEVWCVNNKEEIFKIINIGNSKLYRFILWWQKLLKRIKGVLLRNTKTTS